MAILTKNLTLDGNKATTEQVTFRRQANGRVIAEVVGYVVRSDGQRQYGQVAVFELPQGSAAETQIKAAMDGTCLRQWRLANDLED